MLRSIPLLLLTLFISPAAFSANNSFERLHLIDKDKRFVAVYQFYSDSIENIDSSHAFTILHSLLQQSEQQRDVIIAIATYDRMAHYICLHLQHDSVGIALMQKAVALAEENDLQLEEAYCMYDIGITYFYSTKHLPEAIEYLLRAYEKFENTGFDKIYDGVDFLDNLGYVYYKLGNYEISLRYLKEAAGLNTQNYGLAKNIFNTTALCYRHIGKRDSALIFFQKTFDLAIQNRDSAWIGIASGNIGLVYLKQGLFDKAEPFCQTDYEYNLKDNHPENIAGALTALADINVSKGNADKALQQLIRAEKLLEPLEEYEYDRRLYLYETMSRAYAFQKDYANAYHYQQTAQIVADSIKRRNEASDYIRIQEQLEGQKHLSAVKLLKSERKAEIMKRNFSLIAVLLIFIIAMQVYYRLQAKRKRENELHETREALLLTEKLQAEKDLENARQLLNTQVENLLDKGKLIEQFQSEIDYLQSLPNSPKQVERIEALENLKQSTILTDDAWNEFKTLFEKAHKGFFTRLKEAHRELTQAETRLLTLTKLGLSTKEMASMLGISADSIKKARQRLRKKINLSEEGGLEEVVAAI